MIRSTRAIYDDARFGERQRVPDYETLIQEVTRRRPDAYFEGSAGLERMIFSRVNGEAIGVARPIYYCRALTGYWYRLLPESSILFP